MLRYRDGDASAFEELYARHKGALYRYFLRQCNNRDIAEELYQDTWMKLIGARNRYRADALFKTYLFHIAHNRLVDHYRRNAKGILAGFNDNTEFEPDSLVDDKALTPDHTLDGKRQLQHLLSLIEELPEAQREAFLLREQAGMSLHEIATTIGVNQETAKSRLRYAMAKLRKGLGL